MVSPAPSGPSGAGEVADQSAAATVAAVAAFIQLLTATPPADAVMAAIVSGPLARCHAERGVLYRVDGDEVVLLAHPGYSHEEVCAHTRLPLAIPMPVTQAIATGVAVITTRRGLDRDLADAEVDPGPMPPVRTGSIVAVPAIAGGVTVGGFGFQCSQEKEWRPQDLDMLDGLGRMLAMWLQHPQNDAARAPKTLPGRPRAELTARQRRILTLAATGSSSPAIAMRLGCSESTVKQEISRAMRALQVTRRADAITAARDLGLLEALA